MGLGPSMRDLGLGGGIGGWIPGRVRFISFLGIVCSDFGLGWGCRGCRAGRFWGGLGLVGGVWG